MESCEEILVVLNGERRSLPDGMALVALIERLGLPIQGVLVEHNGRALLRDELPGTCLAANDRVEILRVVAGG